MSAPDAPAPDVSAPDAPVLIPDEPAAAVPAVRYDPWGAEPLQVVDRGRTPRGIRLWQVVAISLGTALLAGGTGGYLGVLAERQSGTRLELPRRPAPPTGAGPPRAWPGSRPPHCPAW